MFLTRRVNAWPRDGPGRPIDQVQLNLLYLLIALDTSSPSFDRATAAEAEAARSDFEDLLARYLTNR